MFASAHGTGFYKGTKQELRRMMAAVRLDDAGRYVLRHTFASVALELGYSDATIAGLRGRGRSGPRP